MAQGVRKWGVAALLLLAGALLRCGFVVFHPWIAGDSLLYGDLARNMLLHHTYGFTDAARIRPTLIRLPGYPMFLAACFALFGMDNFVASLWVQVAIDLVGCALLAGLAARLMGRRAGLIALGLATLCPFTANYCALPLSETCTIFCVSLALFSLERWGTAVRVGRAWNGWLLALAFALAFGILLRPDQALVAVAVLPAMLWIGGREGVGGAVKRAMPAVAVGVAIVLPLLLWGVRNWRVFHVVQPLAPRYANDPGEGNPYGFQRWYKTWAIDFDATVEVYWNYNSAAIALSDLPARAFDNPAQRAETQRLLEIYNNTDTSTKLLDDGFGRLAEQRIAAHPVRYYVELPALKLMDMWVRPRTEYMRLPLDWWEFRAHLWESAVSLAYALWNAVYLVLAAVGLWRWRRQGWSGQRALGGVMVGFVLLRCVLLWTLDNSEPRYTLECFPMVILFAAFAFASRREVGS